MRILVLCPAIGRGGMALVVRRLTRSLAQYAPQDWEFEILGQTYDESGCRVEYPPAWKFTQIDPVEKLPDHPHQFGFLWFNLRHLYAHLERTAPGYDLLWCPVPFWIIRSHPWQIAAPLVTYIPDFAFDVGVFSPGMSHHFRDAVKKIQQRAAITVFTSERHRVHAIDHYHFDPAQTSVISFSADIVSDGFCPTLAEVCRVREVYGLPERYIYAFHPMHSKGDLTILKAMHIARNRSEHVPPLVLAGINTDLITTDAPVDEHIQDVRDMIRAADLQLGRDLFILGKVPENDIGGLFAGATASISASFSEGQLSGNTLSAFLAQCPHLYSALPVYLESIGRGQYGYDFEPGDFWTLAKLLIEVCSDPAEPQRRAERAHRWTQGRTMTDVANEYLDVFRRVMNGK